MEENLSLDNILDEQQIQNLFVEEPSTEQEDSKDANQENNSKENNTTEVVDVETLFTDKPESVGSDKDIQEQEDTTPESSSTSQNNFYSSIAKAFKEEGIFPDLDNESFSNIKSPEDFRDLIEQQIKAGLDEKQKRIDEALSVGIEPSEINKYENTISYLDSINDEQLKQESSDGENLRKQLIFQDFINRGYSKERAQKEVQKSLNAGSDIEDALDALNSNKEFFKEQYNNIINKHKEQEEIEAQNRREQANRIKKSIMEDKNIFGDISIDRNVRQKIYDNIAKPVYKDPDTGYVYTAIQKYEMDNKEDFIKNLGIIFTLTDGFKNLDGLVKNKVRKEVKKGLRELENVINNTSRTSDGTLRFTGGVNEDPESFIGKGWKLDV